MTTRIVAAVALVAAIAPSASAQSAPRVAPTVERMVQPGAVGANRLPVDLPLLIGASPLETNRSVAQRGLGDLRLADAAGHDVPYLFVWPTRRGMEEWQTARMIHVAPGKDTSGFEADLGKVMNVDRINIQPLPAQFLKRVRVDGSGDRIRWTMLVPEGTLFNIPAERTGAPSLRQDVLAFTAGEYRYLRVIWDDHAGGRPPDSLWAAARHTPRSMPSFDSLRVPLVVERHPGGPHISRYHLVLPATQLPVIALEVDVSDPLVLRSVRVTEQRRQGNQLSPVELGMGRLRRVTVGEAVAGNLIIPTNPPAGTDFDLLVDDGDNAPLTIKAVRAVLAPLPYIFFNSADGQPLRATYGGQRTEPIAAPHYDLEALRDTVDLIAAAPARWDAPHPTVAAARDTTTPPALYAAPGAPLDVKRFPFRRTIPPGSGLTAIRLDAAALAHSNVNDLRIVDAEGHQVPYVLDEAGEPLELALPALVPVAQREDVDRRMVPDATTRSWYRVALPYAGLPGATLRLATDARVFKRDVAVVTRPLGRDAQPGAAYGYTMTAVWAHDDPDAAAAPLEIYLGDRLPSDSLFVLVSDGDNKKLAITGATLVLPSYRLRFFRAPGTALTLVYGRTDLPQPSYDLALLAPRLLDAAAQDVAIGAETGEVASNTRVASLVFWGVLGAAVLVLLVMIARLVRSGPIGEAGDAAV